MKKFKWLYIIAIILLLAYLGIRLADQSKIISTFPLDYTNDITSYMSMTIFFEKYGYHEQIFDWYYPKGMITFDIYAPGWLLILYPLFKLFNNIQLATFVSLILLYVFGFLIFLFIGKTERLTRLQTIAFYCFYFISPMAVGDYIRQLRIPQFFGFILLLLIIGIVLYFRNKEITKSFFWTILLFALLIFTHTAEVLMLPFIILPLLFMRRTIKEWLIVGTSSVLGIILSLPWLYTFLKRATAVKTLEQTPGWILDFAAGFKFVNITGSMLAVCLFLIFYFYIKSLNNLHKRKQEITFFSLVLLFTFLYLSRIMVFVPFINQLYPDAILQFIGFFTLFFFFKTKLNKLSEILRFGYKIALVVLPIIFILVSIYHTPFFIKPTQKEIESLDIFDYIQGPYTTAGFFSETLYQNAFISYGSIFYDGVYSTGGWAEIHSTAEHYENLELLTQSLIDKDCAGFLEILESFKTKQVISYGETQCSLVAECGLENKVNKGHLCLYAIKG